MKTLNRNLPTPLHSQLKEALLALIKNGQFREGDLIPTENEIGQSFNVSRITVRRAISELAREGYLTARQGKGTFVTRPKIERPITLMRSFSTATASGGHKPGSSLLALRHDRAGEYIAAALKIRPNDWVWVIERLRLIDDEPIGISTIHLFLPTHLSLAPFELEEDLSLWTILEKKGLILARAEETVEAVAANEQQAQLLQVETGAPLLLVEGIVYTDHAAPIEHHKVFNRGDRYKYLIQAVP
jgi:GntR family transcriptional regulator